MMLLEELKKRSSKWIKTNGPLYNDFYWQDGYSIFSVKPSDTDKVVAYIQNQRKHHEKMTFKEEYLKLLDACHVDYDERYLWD